MKAFRSCFIAASFLVAITLTAVAQSDARSGWFHRWLPSDSAPSAIPKFGESVAHPYVEGKGNRLYQFLFGTNEIGSPVLGGSVTLRVFNRGTGEEGVSGLIDISDLASIPGTDLDRQNEIRSRILAALAPITGFGPNKMFPSSDEYQIDVVAALDYYVDFSISITGVFAGKPDIAIYLKDNNLLPAGVRRESYQVAEDSPESVLKVIPMDYQTGVSLVASEQMGLSGISSASWLALAESSFSPSAQIQLLDDADPNQWSISYHPVRFPIVAFGEASGASPMHAGRTYRFGVVGGAIVDNLASNDLVLRIFEKSTGTMIEEIPIDLPRPPGRPPTVSDPTYPPGWEEFAEDGFRKELAIETTRGSETKTALDLTIEYSPTLGREYGVYEQDRFWNGSSYPLILSVSGSATEDENHFAASELGFVLGFKSHCMLGEGRVAVQTSFSGPTSHYPFNAEVLDNGGTLSLSSDPPTPTHAWMFAFDFSEPLPEWADNFLNRPQFHGTPLPPSYHGKTTEEIAAESPPVDCDFGGMMSKPRWSLLDNAVEGVSTFGGADLRKADDASPLRALSKESFPGDFTIDFQIGEGAQGLIGLVTDPVNWPPGGSMETSFENGLIFDASANLTVIQNGVASANTFARAAGDTFSIRRSGDSLTYYRNDNAEVVVTGVSDVRFWLAVSVDVEGATFQPVAGLRHWGGRVLQADEDQDGLEDEFEWLIINADPNDMFATLWDVEGTDDFDGDGLTNAQEAANWSDPADVASVAVNTVQITGQGGPPPAVGNPTDAANLLRLDNSPELLVHPKLDQFVADFEGNPMALANFVLNEIELVDPIGLNLNGDLDEESVEAPGVTRNALTVLLERQGSPVEQCALLVYLLRRSGYAAGYVFPKRDTLKMLDSSVSKLLKMDIVGAPDAYGGESEIPHEISVNYPWVAAFIDGEWVHLFPWIKDTEIVEGDDFWDYMPAEIDTPMEWVRAYILRQPVAFDGLALEETPLETLWRRFLEHMEQNYPGVDPRSLGCKAVERKHYHSEWSQFPRPFRWVDTGSQSLIENLCSYDVEIFDTVQIELHSIPAEGYPGTIWAPGGLGSGSTFRICDLQNRPLTVHSERFQYGPANSRLRISLAPFRPGPPSKDPINAELPGQWGQSNGGSISDQLMIRAQEWGSLTGSPWFIKYGQNFNTTEAAGGWKLVVTSHRNTRAPTNITVQDGHFLGVEDIFSETFEFLLPLSSYASVNIVSGKVTNGMVQSAADEINRFQAGQSATQHVNNSTQVLADYTAHLMGMSYYQRLAESEDLMERMFKVRNFGRLNVGVSRLDAEDLSLGGEVIPAVPVLDLKSGTARSVLTNEVRASSGGRSLRNIEEMNRLYWVEASALEHVTIDRFVYDEDLDAISTVNLLHRSWDESLGQSTVIELNSQTFREQDTAVDSDLNLIKVTFGGETKRLSEWDPTAWDALRRAFESETADMVTAFVTPGPIVGANERYKGMGVLFLGPRWSSNGALISNGRGGGEGSEIVELPTGWSIITIVEKAADGSLVEMKFLSNGESLQLLGMPQVYAATSSAELPSGEYSSVTIVTGAGSLQNANSGVPQGGGSTSQGIGRAESSGYNGSPRVSSNPPNQVSDPVNVLTGEFYIHETDITLSGAFPLSLQRNYSSREVTANGLGVGWAPAMLHYLELSDDHSVIWTTEMDGTVLKYNRGTGSESDRWAVRWEGNPELQNTQMGRLQQNYVELVQGTGESGSIYLLHGHDGSVREFVAASYPYTSPDFGTVSRKRPYLKEWRDASGNFYSFEYGETAGEPDYGFVRRIKSSSGPFLNLSYSQGRMTEASTSDGRLLKYTYGPFGELTEVRYPDGSSIRYEYATQTETASDSSTFTAPTYLLTKVIRPEGRVLINEYEKENPADPDSLYAESRRVIRQYSNVGAYDSGSAVDQFAPESDSLLPAEESYTPRLTAEFDYSGLADDAFVLDPQSTDYETDTVNLPTRSGVVKVADAYGRITEYEFDANLLIRVTDPLKYSHFTEYYTRAEADAGNGAYRRSVKRSIDRRGLITDYTYDANGNTATITVSGDLDGDGVVTAGEHAVTSTTYNSLNLLEETIAPDPVTGADTGIRTQYEYTDTANPRLLTRMIRSAPDPNAPGMYVTVGVVERDYGSVGGSEVPFFRGALRETRVGETGDFAVTRLSYNEKGLPVRSVRYSGVAQSVAPDEVRYFKYNERQELLSVTDPAGRETRFQYDMMGRRIWRERLDETAKQVGWDYLYYNLNGDLEWTDGSRSNPEDFTYSRYDGMGRVVEEVAWRSQAREDGTGVEAVPGLDLYAMSRHSYNLTGDLIRTIDPTGDTLWMEHDANGRSTSTRVFDGEWEPGGPLEPIGHQTTDYHVNRYDAGGNLLPDNAPDTDVARVIDSHVVESDVLTGAVTTTFVTTTGRPRLQQRADGTVVFWEYYRDGRLKRQPLSPTSYAFFEYDDAARTITRTVRREDGSVLGNPQVSEFDNRGNLTRTTDIAGYQVTSRYDDLGRVLEVDQPHLPSTPVGDRVLATGLIYSASGERQVRYNAVGQKVETLLDALGRPSRMRYLENDDSVAMETSYVYGSLITGFDDHNSVTVYQGQEGEASRPVSQVFTDTFGQVVLSTTSGGMTGISRYNVAGELVSATTRGDLDGDSNADSRTENYAFDALGRLVSHTAADGAVTTFTFDSYYPGPTDPPSGRLLKRHMPSVVADSGQTPTPGGLVEVQRLDSAGRLVESYLESGAQQTRREVYHYHPASEAALTDPHGQGSDDGLLDYWEQQVSGASYRSHSYSYDGWGRPDGYECGQSGASDHVGRTFVMNDPRGFVTSLIETTPAGQTTIDRTYDAHGRIDQEWVKLGSQTIRHLDNDYGDDLRRSSLSLGADVSAAGAAAGTSRGFAWAADGRLTSVTVGTRVLEYDWGTNGLMSSRSNPWRTQGIAARDARGRITQSSTTVTATSAGLLDETLAWFEDDRQASYSATRFGAAVPNETRTYAYHGLSRRLTSENLSFSSDLAYEFDHGKNGGLGIRTRAWTGSGADDWVSRIPDASINTFARTGSDETNDGFKSSEAQGKALGALSVDVTLSGQGTVSGVTHPGPLDPEGEWRAPLKNLRMGVSYTLKAEAHHPSGQYTASGEAAFHVARTLSRVDSQIDDEGKVTSRDFVAVGRTQTLSWDGLGRLVSVAERDGGDSGYDWYALYDGMNRRLRTTTVTITAGVAGSTVAEDSWFDPFFEFLEIGVEVTRVDSGQAAETVRVWQIHGPDSNGSYGGLMGMGGLEAVVDEVSGAWTAILDDQYGHVVGWLTGADAAPAVEWNQTRCSSYGPAPGSPVFFVAAGASVARATAWRGQRMDITGFYWLGARYYEPVSGRFLSPDPLGHGESPSLYCFANGDPLNLVDPTGRGAARQSPPSPGPSSQPPVRSGAANSPSGPLNQPWGYGVQSPSLGGYGSSGAGGRDPYSDAALAIEFGKGWQYVEPNPAQGRSSPTSWGEMGLADWNDLAGDLVDGIGDFTLGLYDSTIGGIVGLGKTVIDAPSNIAETGRIIGEILDLGLTPGELIAAEEQAFSDIGHGIVDGARDFGTRLRYGDNRAAGQLTGAILMIPLGGAKKAPISGADDLAVMGRRLERLGYDQANTNRLLQSIQNGEQVVVVGENMRRVNAVSNMVNNAGGRAVTYAPRNWSGVSRNSLEANRSWIRYWGKDKGAPVIDIGRQPTARPTGPSPFYGIENRSLNRWGIYTPFGN